MNRAERIRRLVEKELLQLRRDPRLLRLVIAAPVLQLVIFGYAVSTDIRHTATFVVDQDRSRASRDLVEAFTASGYFRQVGGSDRSRDLVEALDTGRATMGLHIPPGYARDLAAGNAVVQVLLDGTNSNIATVAQGYAARIVQEHGRARGDVPILPVRLLTRAWFNPDLSSRDYNVPAVLGLVVMLICLLLTSLAVVREKEMGTLEQLLVSPLGPGELIAGKTIPFALITLLDLGIVTAVARLWFRVPFEGSAGLFLLGSFLYILCGLGLGLLVSTVSSTQREAFLATFLIFLPTVLLSGFMFPVSSMPEPFQWMTLGNPMRHYLVVVRGLFLKGAGVAEMWPSLLFLAALSGVLLTVAGRRFRRIGG